VANKICWPLFFVSRGTFFFFCSIFFLSFLLFSYPGLIAQLFYRYIFLYPQLPDALNYVP